MSEFAAFRVCPGHQELGVARAPASSSRAFFDNPRDVVFPMEKLLYHPRHFLLQA
jgi:hypothetical protein